VHLYLSCDVRSLTAAETISFSEKTNDKVFQGEVKKMSSCGFIL
jgi:hypothetical protein